MAQIVNSLFGIDPAALQAQQEKQDVDVAYRFAQLDPMQQAQFAIYRGGAGLGRNVSGFLGGDEQMQRATQIRQLASQFDITSEEGLRQFAQAAANISPEVAQAAIKRADEIKTTGLKQAELQTQAIRNISATTAEKIKQVGQTPDGRQVYQAGDEQYMLAEGGKRVPYYGSLQGKTAKTEVNLGGLTDLFAKKEAEAGGKAVTEQITKAQDALSANSKVSRDIAEVERILPNAFTGQFANFSKTASKTLAGLGIPVSEKASNTETLNALFTNFVLPAVRQLPGSLAAKELDFLRQSKPEALQEPATIKRLVTLLKDDIAANRALVKRADEYRKADKLGSLKDFNIALQQDSIYQDLTKYRQLESRVRSGQKITKEEADFAKQIEKDLGL
jgi:hypothetical protein